MAGKIIIVSNRLPFQIKKKSGQYIVKQSSGGLVSAIQSMPPEKQITWIGAADFKREHWEEYSKQNSTQRFEIVPVFLDKKTENLYYNIFSNTLIWPLFHYFPSFAEYDENSFRAYREVNEQFAEVIKSVASEEDLIWVHDYHLMLVPGFLKSGPKHLSSQFFLHIPFPVYELVKLIPEDWRTEILHSLVSCDILGFQTAEYSSHFKRALSYFLGIETVNNTTTINGHITTIKDYPISIDFDKFDSAYDDSAVVAARQMILKKNEGIKMIFSLDRLDYSKGVSNRLEAYEKLLKENDDLRGKVVFVINVIPSRETISKYAERKRLIEENISRINGIFGSIQWQPIIYQYQHLDFTQLMACYSACDVALVTPLRDGMNLVAKEFVASRKDLRGALILSEFAGAASELSGGAIPVNPNDIHLMRDAMLQAISLSEKEQEQRMFNMREVVRRHNVTAWMHSFLEDVNNAKKHLQWNRPNFMSFYEKMDLFDAYRNAQKRLILLDYDGTLIPFYNKPEEAVPGDVIKDLVAKLAKNKRNRVMLISGRDAATLENWFKNSSIDIVAEHGSMHREAEKEWTTPTRLNLSWKEDVKICIEKYVKLIPGSFTEEKKFSVAWHYRAIENIDEEAIKLSLSKELMMLNMHNDFDILHGNKVIEIKSSLTNKGKFVDRYLEKNTFDFVLAIGDDVTDEDMFNALKEKHHYTIKVGLGHTAARFNLVGVNNVLSFLEQLTNFKEPVVGR